MTRWFGPFWGRQGLAAYLAVGASGAVLFIVEAEAAFNPPPGGWWGAGLVGVLGGLLAGRYRRRDYWNWA